MEPPIIYFYCRASSRVAKEHICLNNFYTSTFYIDNKEFPTVEHYYQARKMTDPVMFERIRRADTPLQAKRLAWKIRIDVNAFNSIRDQVMYEGVKAKFTQNPELREKLLRTGNAVLVEDSNKDMYWGGGLEGSANQLGHILMQLRDELRN